MSVDDAPRSPALDAILELALDTHAEITHLRDLGSVIGVDGAATPMGASFIDYCDQAIAGHRDFIRQIKTVLKALQYHGGVSQLGVGDSLAIAAEQWGLSKRQLATRARQARREGPIVEEIRRGDVA